MDYFQDIPKNFTDLEALFIYSTWQVNMGKNLFLFSLCHVPSLDKRHITLHASPTIFASLQFCGISLRDYFYHPSAHSYVYALILEEVIPFPLSGPIPETAVLSWHSAAILLFLFQPTIFLARNDAALSTLGDCSKRLILLNPTKFLGFLVLAKVSPIHPSQTLL